jgi:hypothetical protein
MMARTGFEARLAIPFRRRAGPSKEVATVRAKDHPMSNLIGIIGQLAKAAFFLGLVLLIPAGFIVQAVYRFRSSRTSRDRDRDRRALRYLVIGVGAGLALVLVGLAAWLLLALVDPSAGSVGGQVALGAAMVGIPLAFLAVLFAGIVSAIRSAARDGRPPVDSSADSSSLRDAPSETAAEATEIAPETIDPVSPHRGQ